MSQNPGPEVGDRVAATVVVEPRLRCWRHNPELTDLIVDHPHLLIESPATAPLATGTHLTITARIAEAPWMPGPGPWLLGRFGAAGLDWDAVVSLDEVSCR